MAKADHLKSMIQIVKGATESLLKDISEEDSLKRVDGYNNHIRWEVGHMAGGMATILKILSGKDEFAPEWRALFGRGNELNEDATVYPPLKDLWNKYTDLNSNIIAFLESAEDESLMEIVELSAGWKMTRVDAVQFFCMHDFYHGGQIAVIRRVIGKDRTFG